MREREEEGRMGVDEGEGGEEGEGGGGEGGRR